MTKDWVDVQPSLTLNEVVTLMKERDCGALPVVDGDGAPIGMVTDRDVSLCAHDRGKALSELKVSDAMSSPVVTCAQDEDIAEAQRRMEEVKVRRLPVVDDKGRVTGALSLAQLACAAGDDRVAEVSGDQIGRTLAVISEPTVGSRTVR